MSYELQIMQTIERGTISWYSTSCNWAGPPLLVQPLVEAIRDGTWKPRFHSLSDCTTLPISSGKKP